MREGEERGAIDTTDMEMDMDIFFFGYGCRIRIVDTSVIFLNRVSY